MSYQKYLEETSKNVMFFIPANTDLPFKQAERITLDFRRLFPYNSLLREYAKKILISNMLARNEVIFNTLPNEYATLVAISREAKEKYTKLLKYNETKNLLTEFLEQHDPKKLQTYFFDNIKELATRLGVDVDVKTLIKAEPYEYSSAFLKQKL